MNDFQVANFAKIFELFIKFSGIICKLRNQVKNKNKEISVNDVDNITFLVTKELVSPKSKK